MEKQFLQNLQVRTKWNNCKRNITSGDIVLLKDENLPRNQWRLARVVETTKDNDGLVRKVRLALSAARSDQN